MITHYFVVTSHARVMLSNLEQSNVLVDPLTGVPTGLLTTVANCICLTINTNNTLIH